MGPGVDRRAGTAQAFVRFDRAAVVASIVGVVLVNTTIVRESAVYLVVPVLGVLLVVLTFADHALRHGRATTGLGLIASGHWFVALAITALLPFIWPVLVLTVLMPMVLATPLLTRRDLFAAVVGSAVAVAATATVGLLGDDGGVIPDVADELELATVILALTAQVIPIALITQHNNHLQLAALADANELNRALSASESALASSRLRLTEVADTERRRLERDLHDGPQQRILALGMHLRRLRADPSTASPLVDAAIEEVAATVAELREVAHGIYPPILQASGLAGALRSTVRSLPWAVDAAIEDIGRRDETIEASSWYVAREALSNVTKHAEATSVAVALRGRPDGGFVLSVRDDGVGLDATASADGAGLANLHDRAAVIGADLRIESPAGGGTIVELTVAGPDPKPFDGDRERRNPDR